MWGDERLEEGLHEVAEIVTNRKKNEDCTEYVHELLWREEKKTGLKL